MTRLETIAMLTEVINDIKDHEARALNAGCDDSILDSLVSIRTRITEVTNSISAGWRPNED